MKRPPPREAPSPQALRRRRASLGLTASDLADMAGIGEAEVIMMEQGALPAISPDAWSAICSALRLGSGAGINPPPPVKGTRQRKGLSDGSSAPLPCFTEQTAPQAPWWVQLRLQRARLGMTRSEIEKHSGVNARTVAALEAGSYPGDSTRLRAYRNLATALAIDPPELPVLPAIQTDLWSVAGRSERGELAARLAAASPKHSPASVMIPKRLGNGWSRERTARAIGAHHPSDIECAEVLQAWPLAPSPVFQRLCGLWRIPAPYFVVGRNQPALAKEGRRKITERLTSQCEAWGLDREQVCLLADLSPIGLDAVLTAEVSRLGGEVYWRAVASLTAAGFNLAERATVSEGALYWRGEGGRKSEMETTSLTQKSDISET